MLQQATTEDGEKASSFMPVKLIEKSVMETSLVLKIPSLKIYFKISLLLI